MTHAQFLLLPALLATLALTGCGGGSDNRDDTATRDVLAPTIVPFGPFGTIISDSPSIQIKDEESDASVQNIPVVGPATTVTVTVFIQDQSALDTRNPPQVLFYSLVNTGGQIFLPFPMERYTFPGLGTPVTPGSGTVGAAAPTENGYWRVKTVLPQADSGLMTVAVRATDTQGNTKTQPVGTIYYSAGKGASATLVPYVPPFTSTGP